MAGTKRTCVTCKNKFIGRVDAKFCSPACRQRARRSRGGGKCDTAVTDTGPKRATVETSPAVAGGHTAEALELLAALNAEAAENAEARGEQPLEDGEDDWSAAERMVLEMIACAVDRKVDLTTKYEATEDAKLRVKLSGELRLLQSHIAQLLKQVKTDLPPAPTQTSRKAQNAANARWDRERRGSGQA